MLTSASNASSGGAVEDGGGGVEMSARAYIWQWAVCILGIIGNLLVLFIYVRKRPKAPSETFIIVIAGVDLAMNLAELGFTVYRVLFHSLLHVCLLSNGAFDVVNTTSSVLVILMTVNRYVAICHPHSYKQIYTSVRVNLMLGGTLLWALLCATPGQLLCLVYFTQTGSQFQPSKGGIDYVKLSWIVLRAAMLVAAAVIMFMLYYKVALTLKEKRRRSQMRKSGSETTAAVTLPMAKNEVTQMINVDEKEEEGVPEERKDSHTPSGCGGARKASVFGKMKAISLRKQLEKRRASSGDNTLTLTLFVISVVYILLMLPDVTVNILDSLHVFPDNKTFEKYRVPAQMLFCINFLTNPVIYLLCNNFFKTEMRRLFCRQPIR